MKLAQVRAIFCVIILSEIISSVSSKNATNPTKGISDHINNQCTRNDKCIMKCCAFGKYIITEIVIKEDQEVMKRYCGYFNETKESTNFDEDFANVFVNKLNLSRFDVKTEIFKINKTFRIHSIDIATPDFDFNLYLNERAEVELETPNAYDRLTRIPNDMYCLDSVIVKDENHPKTLKPGVWVLYKSNQDEASREISIVVNVGMLVSCFFLVVVLVVYGILPELRNLCGQILMAYVASLLGAFLLLAVLRIQKHDSAVCEGLTYPAYFFILASFCWMNVMSYDIWWTFRGYAKARPIHRRGEGFKFMMYCLYATGVPLGMTIMLAVLNHVNLRHVPWFVTPKIPSSCFIAGGERLLYLYMPMLLLISCNWLFFLMTAFNVWRLSRGTAVLDSAAAGTPQAHRSNRRRFIIYLKLSVVMGLNWVLEIVSYSCEDNVIWLISDCYNILVGVFIFLIFVCKRKILKKLKKRLMSGNHSKWYPGHEDSSKVASSTCDSSATQEIPRSQIAVP